MDDDYGTVAVGKVASLVVWDGPDPFELSTWAERVFVRSPGRGGAHLVEEVMEEDVRVMTY